jgi:hypothetical protein
MVIHRYTHMLPRTANSLIYIRVTLQITYRDQYRFTKVYSSTICAYRTHRCDNAQASIGAMLRSLLDHKTNVQRYFGHCCTSVILRSNSTRQDNCNYQGFCVLEIKYAMQAYRHKRRTLFGASVTRTNALQYFLPDHSFTYSSDALSFLSIVSFLYLHPYEQVVLPLGILWRMVSLH